MLNSDGFPIPVLPYLYFGFSCSLISAIWLKNILQKDIQTCLKTPSDGEFTTSLNEQRGVVDERLIYSLVQLCLVNLLPIADVKKHWLYF